MYGSLPQCQSTIHTPKKSGRPQVEGMGLDGDDRVYYDAQIRLREILGSQHFQIRKWTAPLPSQGFGSIQS